MLWHLKLLNNFLIIELWKTKRYFICIGIIYYLLTLYHNNGCNFILFRANVYYAGTTSNRV